MLNGDVQTTITQTILYTNTTSISESRQISGTEWFDEFFIPAARATHVWRKHIAAIHFERLVQHSCAFDVFYIAYMRMVSYSDWLRCCCRDNYSLHHTQMAFMPRRVCGYFRYRNDSDIRQTLGVQCHSSVLVFP